MREGATVSGSASHSDLDVERTRKGKKKAGKQTEDVLSDSVGIFFVREQAAEPLDITVFSVRNCQECQIYVHQVYDRISVDLSSNSAIVLGPVKEECEVNMTNESKLVVFCHQLIVRNSTNLQIMLFSPTPPVLEGCSDISFLPMTYAYAPML